MLYTRSKLGTAAVAVAIFVSLPLVCWAQHGRRCECGVPSYMTPGTIVPPTVPAPEMATPEVTPPEVEPTVPQPEPTVEPEINFSPDTGSNSFGLASSEPSAAPNMIGDFLPPGTVVFFSSNEAQLPATGGTRLDIGQNNSPTPQDRIYFTYNHFQNAFQLPNTPYEHLDLFTVGAERTFFDGMASLEVRVPFFSGPDNNQTLEVLGPDNDSVDVQFGNVAFILKGILAEGADYRVTIGSGLELPTGPDTVAVDEFFPFGTYRINNNATSLTPFMAALYTPSEFCFLQSFVQYDIPLNQNEISYRSETFARDGYLQEQRLLKFDVSGGVWLFRDNARNASVRGVALIAELHYTTTTNDADIFEAPDPIFFGQGPTVGNIFNRVDVLNTTLGTTIDCGMGSLTLGYALPLNELDDGIKVFDGEFLAHLNINF